jgi:hypothetical protein
VGEAEAPDARAAQRAASFLDYRVTRVRVDHARARDIADRVARRVAGLERAEARSLVPALAVQEDAAVETVLAGFGTTRLSRRMEAALHAFGLSAPIVRANRGTAARSRLSTCAYLLGLPPAFARPRRRPPLSGSGLARAFAGKATGPARRVIIT